MAAKIKSRRLLQAGIVVALIALASPALLAEERGRAADSPERRGVGLRLDSERLAPSVSIELEALAAFRQVMGLGDGQHDHVLFEQFSDNVERGATRVTRRALKNYFLDAMQLDRGIDRLKTGVGGDALGGDRLDFNFGVHSGLPELGMRYRLGQGIVRFRLGAEGEMGVHFRFHGAERTEFGAYFDGDDEVSVRARLGF